MRGFSHALRADLHGTNIGVTLVVAGKVSSAYFENNPGTEERLPKIGRLYPTLTPEQVAAAIVKAIQKNRREIIIPFSLYLTFQLHRFLPRLVESFVVRTGWQRPSL